MKRFLFACVILLTASRVDAQTASWNQPNVASLAQAQAFTYAIIVTPPGGATESTSTAQRRMDTRKVAS